MPATSDTHYFSEEHCLPTLSGTNKEEVIAELIQSFVASKALSEQQALELSIEVLAREEEATTGIGKGVAMPHARASRVVDGVLVAVGVHHEGIDFDSLDGAPVHVVFLIAASDSQEYLRVAGRIARVGRDEVEVKALPRQPSAKAMVAFLEESWTNVGS